MNEEALNDSFNLFASQGYNGSIEDYKELMVSNKDARADSYNLFTGQGYNGTDTDFNDLIGVSGQVTLTDDEVGKTNDSANADPSAESNVTDSTSENGSSVSQEKDTAVERLFGKNFITDFAGDLYRSAASGWTQGESLDSAMDIFNDGKNMTEDQYVEFVNQSRAMENAGQTDEMIDFSEQYAKDKKEYGSVGAFFTSWWKNPTVMTQYTVQSLSNMASSAMNSDDAALIAAGGATLGAAVGTAATPIGTVIGGLAGGMGALSGTMEVGFTTAQLLQEAAVEAGKDWNTMSDTERIDWTKEVVNNKDLYDDLTNKALKRGIAIGAIDAVTGVLSGGAGNLARKTVSTTARSAMAGAAEVAAVAATETTGGLASEIAGQLAADQELNAQEILTEGFADKTFTIINVAQGGLKAPKYTLAGEKMNGKRFREAVQIMDDATIATAELEISNDPLMEKIILNRKTDIKIDQEIDATISGVDDRAEIIKLQKKLNKLKGNDSVTAKNTRSELTSQITEIQDKYKGSEVDVTIKQRQEAVAKAVDTKFEENFNKYYKGAKKAAKDLGFKQGPKIYKTTKGYEKAIAAKFKFDSFDKYIEAVAKDKNISIEKAAKISRGSDGVFLGEGTMFIDKQKAKEVGAISGASHELLHPVFNAAIGSANAQGKIVKEFKKAMTSKQKRFVRNKLKANVKPENWNTEYLNYFSDAILKGEINYDKTLFEKLKDIVLGILKGAGFDNVSFDSGREVYNFLKEYNTSLKETGQVSEKAVEAIKTAETKRTTKLRKENSNAPEVKAATVSRVGDIQKSVNQEILDLTDALDAAEDAYADDADNPTLLKNVELAEKALEEAEERALSGKPVVVKPKEEKKKVVKKEPKPVRTTNLAPQTAQDKKIMDTYNEGMKDTKRTSFTSSNPLPAKVENKLIPLFEGYINTLVQQKFKQYQSEALEFQDALSILRVEAVNALRTFNPARNENLSGYVRRLIALRQPKMFEKANKEFTSSLDGVDIEGDAGVIRSFANEETVAPESLIKASKVISTKVKDNLVSMVKAWASQNNINFDLFRFGDVDANATVIVDGKKVTILHELLKELFPDVNPEKFLDSSTMFTGPEASIVLEKLASNEQELIELFINLLPRGAVMPKGKNKAIVKDDNYGKSTKLDKSILTAFYNKGDISERFTKDAGLIPFTLKDNVRYSDVHKAFGMDSAGNKLNYKRSGKGSAGPVLASAYKMLGRLIMNEIIRTDLNLTAEQKMNVGAGKSDLQFSKNASVLEALNVEGTENFRNIFAHHSEKYRKEGQDLLIELAYRFTPEEVRDYILPLISDVDGSNYDGDSKLLFKNKDDFFRKLKKYRKSKFGDYKPRQQRISVEGGAELKLAKVTSKYYQGASFIENIKAFVGNIKDRQTFAKEQQKGLLKIVKTLSEILDETSSKKGGFDGKKFKDISLGIFAYFNYLNTKNKNGILRTSAVPTQMAIIPRLLGFKDTPVKYIYEHTQTASDTSGELLQLIFNKFAKNQKFGKDANIEKEFKEIMNGYTVALIPKIYDTLLNTIAKENGDRENTKTRKDYIKKLLKPGEDGIPTRYKIPAFESLLEEYGLESLQDILTPISKAAFENEVGSDATKQAIIMETQFSISRIETADILNKANNNANNINAKPKGISVWDFDDTLAKTKSNVLYTMPDGTKGKLNAEEFAKKGDQMLEEGVEFDFSEFSKVVNGSKGPFFEKAMARNKKFGNKNVFILTARPANSESAIHEFLKGIGLDIPLQNITGLANSSPQAKANWVVGKAAEGYNDFYFADDATQNVKAVDKALKKLPVKSKAELAVIKKSDIQFSMNTKYTTKWAGLRDLPGNESARDLVTSGTLRVGENTIGITIDDGAAPGSEALDFEFPDLGTIEIGFDINTYDVDAKLSPKDKFKIFGAVINAVTAKVKSYGDEVSAITFSGLGRSRSSLYTLMAQRYAAELGWKMKSAVRMTTDFATKEMQGNYVIYRPKVELAGPSDNTYSLKKQPKAVQDVLKTIDIKSQVQQARVRNSLELNQQFNMFLEKSTGIESFKKYKSDKAKLKGRFKGKLDVFIPPSAEDFLGLLYQTLNKGKLGDAQIKFYEDNLLKPYAKANSALRSARVRSIREFDAIKKKLKIVPKDLKKSFKFEDENGNMKDSLFSKEQAIRVYIWNAQGIEMPNLSQVDLAVMVNHVNAEPELKAFADELLKLNRGMKSKAPSKNWMDGNIGIDLQANLNSVGRKKLLEVWQQNVDAIFSEENLNKLEAAYGPEYVKALKNSLRRMRTGRSAVPVTDNEAGNNLITWLNSAVGNIMFFNNRSALLQMLSATNFLNFEENNIIAAGKALMDIKQYSKDFMTLMNSDYLVDRRDGTRINVNEADIALIAKQSGIAGVISKILEKGFLPTKYADSLAIGIGGATFYRTKINALMKEGMSKAKAEAQAMQEFISVAETSQQSSDQSKISMEQAGSVGKIILAFNNTSSQYSRIIKRSVQDLYNRRGSDKANLARIVYYGGMQNLLFNFMQQAMFAAMWGGEDDEEVLDGKKAKIVNSMADGLLRGMGVKAAIFVAMKNTAIKLYERSKKDVNKDYRYYAVMGLLALSPPLSSKASKISKAASAFQYGEDKMKYGKFGLDSPKLEIGANLVSFATSLPTDRLLRKAINVSDALDASNEPWERLFMAMGWPKWTMQSKAESDLERKEDKAEIKEAKEKAEFEAMTPLEQKTKALEDLKKFQQVDSLKAYGLTDKEIRLLTKEEDRVNKILSLEGSEKKGLTPADKAEEELYDLKKKQQVDSLTKYGLTKKQIRDLKYEEDRVNEILRLRKKNKKIKDTLK